MVYEGMEDLGEEEARAERALREDSQQKYFELLTSAESMEYSEGLKMFKDYLGSFFARNENLESLRRAIKYSKDSLETGVDHPVRFMINLDSLRNFNQSLTSNLIQKPTIYLPACEEAFKTSLIENFSDGDMKTSSNHSVRLFVGISGAFENGAISPRKLLASRLGQLVSVEGIVTKVSLVRPKLETAVMYNPAAKRLEPSKQYRDVTSMRGLPTSSALQKEDKNGNPLELEFGLSTYVNTQKIVLQEMPEKAPLGQLPRSVEVLVEDDLVDKVKPGDRISVCGVFRALPHSLGGVNQFVTGNFRTMILGNAIEMLGKEISNVDMTGEDIKNIQMVGRMEKPFDRLARSLAPSIYGHSYIKKALLLLLLGGIEKNLPTGAHLRGDINILLVGDPSTAKSQLLRFVLSIAPVAISTTGRGR